ncbi:MAG: DUF1207 domain-containing protein [Ignavibacteria bacterium]|nr:DUF1207 domain-containing protein [Ignavibacteria bacterium]MDH7527348.1 DUF1207 domain-containing protein [Ignavibacteria bacterium]
MKIKLLFLVLILFSETYSQIYLSNRIYSKTILFPDYRLFPSNFSDPMEAKTGTQFYLDAKSLELNIGASRDLIHHQFNWNNTLAFGLEFFNWSLLNREKQFKFPVMAVDYFFGGYFVFYHNSRNLDWANRIRVSHISAHLSDGSFDKNQNQWVNNNEPFTYSREFVQWTSAFIYRNLNFYFDAIYLFHSIPEWKFNTITGIGTEAIIIGFPELHTKIFSGFDLKFQKFNGEKFETNKNFSAGFVFGNQSTTHLRLAYQYFDGYNFHGQLFHQKLKQSFINISVVI